VNAVNIAAIRCLGAALMVCVSAPAFAQSQCKIPAKLASARAEFPPPGSAVSAPITGYQLVMSWGPQFCKVNGDDKKHAPRCKDQKFGFTLDSLRADGVGRKNPVYCQRMGAVPGPVARANYCATPSISEMSHIWAKYGSCIASDAATYFDAGRKAFETFRAPDMNALSQKGLDVGGLRSALAFANPGTRPEMFSVGLTPLGWLDHLRLCLDTRYQPRPCPADVGGAGDGAAARIWPNY